MSFSMRVPLPTPEGPDAKSKFRHTLPMSREQLDVWQEKNGAELLHACGKGVRLGPKGGETE